MAAAIPRPATSSRSARWFTGNRQTAAAHGHAGAGIPRAIDGVREVADSGEAKNWGIKAKTGEQTGERFESLKVEILYLQGLQDIFREVSHQ